ncbi:hypothetical protein [Actinoplanes sp. L3-i22]|uniref:hypothetical protein n=1 Tax=Actinoplanes sp. L3-i22 TaxID=2836373 RepID=UPI001C7598C5|nr:hypothetical protein [Actinoplanes sp. L3-i22]BCY05428.1 hypothetical protein L3i22_005160 [Actinoplanes sp. L3-i22]
MGYSGELLVARSAQPLAGSPAIGETAVLFEKELGGGWRYAQLDGGASDALAELVRLTGAPALSAFVIDSDAALVEAASPAGVSWAAHVHPERAAEMGAPALGLGPAEIVERAVAWAAEAGLTADAGAVAAVLASANTFAEETFEELLDALGITA